MGPIQDGHTHLFFKFQSSKYLPTVEKVWPDTKWIYLFRDPLEVIASNLKVRAVDVFNCHYLCIRLFDKSPLFSRMKQANSR